MLERLPLPPLGASVLVGKCTELARLPLPCAVVLLPSSAARPPPLAPPLLTGAAAAAAAAEGGRAARSSAAAREETGATAPLPPSVCRGCRGQEALRLSTAPGSAGWVCLGCSFGDAAQEARPGHASCLSSGEATTTTGPAAGNNSCLHKTPMPVLPPPALTGARALGLSCGLGLS